MENPITGKYPVIIDGENTGELTITSIGLMTGFDAYCRDCGSVLRLSVYGDDGEGYLGVMMPDGGQLRLRKKLSRSAMSGFPKSISHAGPAGFGTASVSSSELKQAEVTVITDEPSIPVVMAQPQGLPEALPPITDQITKEVPVPDKDPVLPAPVVDPVLAPVEDPAPQIISVKEPIAEQPETDSLMPESNDVAEGSEVTIWKPAPNPWSMFSDTMAKMSLRNVRGALSTTKGDKVYLAIPGDADEFDIIEQRNIEGIMYSIVEADN